MLFYISVMFLGFPDDIHEAKPLFLQFKKKTRYRRTNGQTDPLIEMQGRILKRNEGPQVRDLFCCHMAWKSIAVAKSSQ